MPHPIKTPLAPLVALAIAAIAVGCGSGGSSSTVSSTAPTSATHATKGSVHAKKQAPHGGPVPEPLRGAYTAHFGRFDEQTTGTWHLVLGPGHHAKIWNPADNVANTPNFEAGPVYFSHGRMTFANVTARGICRGSATYSYTLRGGALRFRLVGSDPCQPRSITFPVNTWQRR